MWIVSLVTIILFVIGIIVINAYSGVTGEKYCKDLGMEFDKLNEQHPFDWQDDVICYTVYNNEMKFYYYVR